MWDKLNSNESSEQNKLNIESFKSLSVENTQDFYGKINSLPNGNYHNILNQAISSQLDKNTSINARLNNLESNIG